MGNRISLRAALKVSCARRAVGVLAGLGIAAGAVPAMAQTAADSNANAPVNLDLGAVLATGNSGGAVVTETSSEICARAASGISNPSMAQPASVAPTKAMHRGCKKRVQNLGIKLLHNLVRGVVEDYRALTARGISTPHRNT